MKASVLAATAAAALTLGFAAPAAAQDYPVVPGEYVDMSYINIDDGHNLDYANFLAGEWRAQEEFAKSQGWISSYEIWMNIYKRQGEPDIVLVTRYASVPDKAEMLKREAIMKAKMKMTDAQMEASSGDRAKYRHVIGGQMFQVLDFK